MPSSATKIHEFNPGRKSWQLYAHHIKTIGDDLIIEASGNQSEIYFKQKNDLLYYKISDFDLCNNIHINRINPSGNNGNVLTISGGNVEWANVNGFPSITNSNASDHDILTVSGSTATWTYISGLPGGQQEGQILTISGQNAAWTDYGITGIDISTNTIKIGENISTSSSGIIFNSSNTQTSSTSSNSIVLNASSNGISPTNSGFFVSQISNSGSLNSDSILYYDTTTNEVKYGSAPQLSSSSSSSPYFFDYSSSQKSILIGEDLNNDTSATGSILIGKESAINGSYNISIGYKSFAGQKSVSIGAYSGGGGSSSYTNAINNVSIGYYSNVGDTSGSIAIGYYSKADSNYEAIAIGYEAEAKGTASISLSSYACTTSDAHYSISIGYYSKCEDISSVAIGEYSYTNGQGCVALGRDTSAVGNYATVIGNYSQALTNSVCIGHSSSTSGTSSDCIIIGHNSTITNCTNSIIIGNNVHIADKNNCICIGSGSQNDSTNNRIVFGSSYTVFIGSSSFTTSDDRLKHDEVDISNAFNTIEQLQPQIYKKTKKMFNTYDSSYNIGEKGTDWFYEAGLIAQDVYTIDELKEFVQVGDEEKLWYLGYNNIFTYNIAAIKELIAKIKILENENISIENENTLISNKLNEVLRDMGKVEI